MNLLLVLLPALAAGQLGGGISETQVSGTYEPVVYAVKTINDQMQQNGPHAHELTLVEVVHARTQVVAGQKLYLTLHLTGDYFCDIDIWYREWLHGDERLQVTDGPNCTKHQAAPRQARAGEISGRLSLPGEGGSQEETMVLNGLKFASCAVNDRINSMFAYVLGDTSAVQYTQQVTAGMTYRFYDVTLMPTTCRNNGCASLDTSTCHINQHGGQNPMKCSFVVQSQPWMTPSFTLTSMQC